MRVAPDWNSFLAASLFAARTCDWWAAESAAIFSADGFTEDDDRLIDRVLAEHPLANPGDALRRHRQLHALRIAWRDVSGRQGPEAIGAALAALAEKHLHWALESARHALEKRWPVPLDSDGKPCRFAVIALGKLGGLDLNFSSDIDLLFIASCDGVCFGARALTAEEYHLKLARQLVALLDTPSARGRVWRVDTRLRPYGTAGPLVCSLAAAEQYYQTAGREWERYALIKARYVAGDAELAAEFIAMTRPFVFRRYLDYGLLDGVRQIHADILSEASRQGRLDDLKRGPGGIREIEFLVQSHQLLRGGSDLDLRTPQTLAALDAIRRRELLSEDDIACLAAAYRTLRTVENRVQMLDDRQTHCLPAEPDNRARLAVLMGQPWSATAQEIERFRREVRIRFERQFKTAPGPEQTWRDLLRRARLVAAGREDEAAGGRLLHALGLTADDDPASWRRLQTALAELERGSMSATAHRRLDTLLPLLFQHLAASGAGEAALWRSLDLIAQIIRRSAYLALLLENRQALERLVRLLAQSATLADWIGRQPALLDELIDPTPSAGLLERRVFDETLRIRLAAAGDDPERRHAALTAIHRSHRFKTAVQFLTGNLDAAGVMRALTQGAEAILATVLDTQFATAAERRNGFLNSGFSIIGYGALGAKEMHFHSDLDLVFLFDSSRLDESAATRMARRYLHWLTLNGAGGRLYEIDTRLRPNGQSGQLVSSIAAFVKYQRSAAWTWEIQALARARPVAGDQNIAALFSKTRRDILTRLWPEAFLVQALGEMRDKLRAAHRGADPIKHGAGGLLDIQFLVHYHLLRLARLNPWLTASTQTADLLARLPSAAPHLTAEAEALLTAWRELQEGRLRLELTGQNTNSLEITRYRVAEVWNEIFKPKPNGRDFHAELMPRDDKRQDRGKQPC